MPSVRACARELAAPAPHGKLARALCGMAVHTAIVLHSLFQVLSLPCINASRQLWICRKVLNHVGLHHDMQVLVQGEVRDHLMEVRQQLISQLFKHHHAATSKFNGAKLEFHASQAAASHFLTQEPVPHRNKRRF